MSPRPGRQSAADRKRSLGAERQRRWRERQKERALARVGLPEDAKPVDVAELLLERLAERLSDEELDLLDRDVQGAMRIALGAASIKDKRQQVKPVANAAHIFALIEMTEKPTARQIGDGIIEGEAREVDPELVRDGPGDAVDLP